MRLLERRRSIAQHSCTSLEISIFSLDLLSVLAHTPPHPAEEHIPESSAHAPRHGVGPQQIASDRAPIDARHRDQSNNGITGRTSDSDPCSEKYNCRSAHATPPITGARLNAPLC